MGPAPNYDVELDHMDLGPAELVIILAIVLLLFGSAKLPKLARSLGQASKEFKEGLKHGADGPEGAAGAPATPIAESTGRAD